MCFFYCEDNYILEKNSKLLFQQGARTGTEGAYNVMLVINYRYICKSMLGELPIPSHIPIGTIPTFADAVIVARSSYLPGTSQGIRDTGWV